VVGNAKAQLAAETLRPAWPTVGLRREFPRPGELALLLECGDLPEHPDELRGVNRRGATRARPSCRDGPGRRRGPPCRIRAGPARSRRPARSSSCPPRRPAPAAIAGDRQQRRRLNGDTALPGKASGDQARV